MLIKQIIEYIISVLFYSVMCQKVLAKYQSFLFVWFFLELGEVIETQNDQIIIIMIIFQNKTSSRLLF